jgi:hypothetical protein
VLDRLGLCGWGREGRRSWAASAARPVQERGKVLFFFSKY